MKNQGGVGIEGFPGAKKVEEKVEETRKILNKPEIKKLAEGD